MLQSVARSVIEAGPRFGESRIGAGRRVNVEYVSANPTGPMHVGHCRGAVVGDALANLLAKTGHRVTKEYYINDAGAQVIALTWAAYWRYLQAIGTQVDVEAFSALTPTGLQYQGEYLIPVGETLAAEHGKSLADVSGQPADPSVWFEIVRTATLRVMMEEIRTDLGLLGINHEVFSSEAETLASGQVDEAINALDAKGLLYEACSSHPRARHRKTGSRAPRPCSAPRSLVTTLTVHCANLMAATPILPMISLSCPEGTERRRADRRAWRRSWRLCLSYAGCRERPDRWQDGIRGCDVPDRAHHEGRRACAHVQACRHLRHTA
ncbi:arginine--tRNA ligase domain-containing protein [Asaia prunellae]|uniref:arginine--tRNA ligase domain-containing protein n=1 Tax=Asaia prunellae TaxID=610245 RepID=UPI000AD727DC|nr:arginine--tRNA ligase [Asaia prunellae]